jgi:hypothetical protein
MADTSSRTAGTWVGRHKVAAAVAGAALLAGAVLTANALRDGGDSLSASNDPGQVTEERRDGPTDAFPIERGDWRLDSFEPNDRGLGTGSFGGTGSVTYIGDNPEGGTGSLYVTVYKDGQQVAYLTGVTKFLRPSMREEVYFISSDKFVPGPYAYDFAGSEPVSESASVSYPPG